MSPYKSSPWERLFLALCHRIGQTPPMVMKVAGIQMDVRLGEVAENLVTMSERAEAAAKQGARLVIFPECAVSGYCFESLDEALGVSEPIPGPSTLALTTVCERLQIHMVVGMLEKGEDGALYNAAVLIGSGGVVASYRKAHLPFLGVDRFTTPGDRPFEVATADALRVGMNICYDATFPEAARVLMLEGADLIALPTNWPPGSEPAAAYVINARALENHLYYAAINRVGVERGFEFIGHSRICGPGGETLADAPHRNECILYAEIDPEAARNKRIVRVSKRHEIHRYRDRRPDLYSEVVADRGMRRFRGDSD